MVKEATSILAHHPLSVLLPFFRGGVLFALQLLAQSLIMYTPFPLYLSPAPFPFFIRDYPRPNTQGKGEFKAQGD